MKHLLKLLDLSKGRDPDHPEPCQPAQVREKHNIEHHYLKGKTLGMIFEKSSTRTRVSFETGMYQLGGMALFLSASDMQIGRGEPVQDTARVLSRYLDGIMIRTYEQEEVESLARYGTIPVINGLTDFCHPCQVLADLMTVREYKGSLDGLKLCFIGDGNNMMHSLIVGGLKTGMRVSVACPEGYRPADSIPRICTGFSAFSMTDSPLEAAKDADVVVTDVWASMGQEEEARSAARRLRAIRLTMRSCVRQSRTRWCCTACRAPRRGDYRRGVRGACGGDFEEAENRLHAQKAVLVKLMRD